MQNKKANVLSLAGHDPTGGAGIQADVETIKSLDCHACSVITTLTVQNTCNVMKTSPVAVDLIEEQLQCLTNDIRIDAIKIGLLGALKTTNIISRYLSQLQGIPIVLDPVLAAGGGAALANTEMIEAIHHQLLPITMLSTPNSLEARQLAPQADNLSQCAELILSSGCQYVLITGAHEPGSEVINQLYSKKGLLNQYHWPRLKHEYHGSGCTLSAAIAARLAQGATIFDAVEQAQQFTWDSLNSGYQPGGFQYIPNRNH